MKQGKPETVDWINYLSTLYNTNVNLTIIFVSTVFLVMVAIYQILNSEVVNQSTIRMLWIFEIIVAIAFFSRFNRAIKYQTLIHNIMIGEIKTNEEILKEYNKITKYKEKDKRKGIVMSFKESINSFLGHLKKSIELMIVALAGGFMGAILTAYANIENPTGEGVYLVLLMFGFFVLFIAVMLFFIDYVTKKK